jgi:hypothetical protein
MDVKQLHVYIGKRSMAPSWWQHRVVQLTEASFGWVLFWVVIKAGQMP